MKKSKLGGWKNRLIGAAWITAAAAAGIIATARLAARGNVSGRLIVIIWAAAVFLAGAIPGEFGWFASMKSDEYYQSDKAGLFAALRCMRGHHCWNGCLCEVCGEIRAEGHDRDGCSCRRCGKALHTWKNGVCAVCGAACNHPSTDAIYTQACGERGDFAVTLEKCRECGELIKTGSGRFPADMSGLLDITADDIEIAGDK